VVGFGQRNRRSRLRTQGLSATSRKVICARRVRRRCGTTCLNHDFLLVADKRPGWGAPDRRTTSAIELTLFTIANSTERTCKTFAPSESQFQAFLERTWSSRRAFGTFEVCAGSESIDAVDVVSILATVGPRSPPTETQLPDVSEPQRPERRHPVGGIMHA